jgi:hypothetical protein
MTDMHTSPQAITGEVVGYLESRAAELPTGGHRPRPVVGKRLAEAAQWLIARVVNDSGLKVQALADHAVITKPGRRGNGPVRICYAGGAVYHNGTCLGMLDGYEPGDGRRIGQAEILAALNGNTP